MKSLKIIGLVVLLIVDLVAIGLAVKHVNKTPEVSNTSVTIAATPTPTVGASAPASDDKPQKLTGLAVTGSTIATYASGDCKQPGSAAINVSTDKGVHFNEVALPLAKKTDADGNRSASVASVLGLVVTAPKELSLVGMGTDCKPVEYSTTDGGENWKKVDRVTDWYVEQGKVGTPTGVVDPGCEALSLSPISDRNAKVACSDGQIRGTDDTGETWIGLASLDGMTSASFSSLMNGMGIAKTADCGSRAYSTSSGGGTWTAAGCIDKAHKADAIDGAAGLFAALVDGGIYISSDQGATWVRTD